MHNLGGQTKCQLCENIIMQNGLEPSCVWPAHAAAAYWGQEAVGVLDVPLAAATVYRVGCTRRGCIRRQKGQQNAAQFLLGTRARSCLPAYNTQRCKPLCMGLTRSSTLTRQRSSPFLGGGNITQHKAHERTNKQSGRSGLPPTHPPTHPPTCLNSERKEQGRPSDSRLRTRDDQLARQQGADVETLPLPRHSTRNRLGRTDHGDGGGAAAARGLGACRHHHFHQGARARPAASASFLGASDTLQWTQAANAALHVRHEQQRAAGWRRPAATGCSPSLAAARRPQR